MSGPDVPKHETHLVWPNCSYPLRCSSLTFLQPKNYGEMLSRGVRADVFNKKHTRWTEEDAIFRKVLRIFLTFFSPVRRNLLTFQTCVFFFFFFCAAPRMNADDGCNRLEARKIMTYTCKQVRACCLAFFYDRGSVSRTAAATSVFFSQEWMCGLPAASFVVVLVVSFSP